MGSPLAPVVPDLCVDHFEEPAEIAVTNKSTLWYRYVENSFIVWPHGKVALQAFL
jgi:hypothetical protein